LAVAQACGASFIRAEGFVFAHVADEGVMESADAGPLLRFRKQIGAERVAVIADIKKKHASHSITADVDLVETARAAEFFGAEGIVVTGVATGRPASVEEVRAARAAVTVPVAIGSGLTPENLEQYWAHADAFIVGSYVKHEGLWSNPIDRNRLTRFLSAASRLRGLYLSSTEGFAYGDESSRKVADCRGVRPKGIGLRSIADRRRSGCLGFVTLWRATTFSRASDLRFRMSPT
jgi:membrane complex biogenesis BtpA family protein